MCLLASPNLLELREARRSHMVTCSWFLDRGRKVATHGAPGEARLTGGVLRGRLVRLAGRPFDVDGVRG